MTFDIADYPRPPTELTRKQLADQRKQDREVRKQEKVQRQSAAKEEKAVKSLTRLAAKERKKQLDPETRRQENLADKYQRALSKEANVAAKAVKKAEREQKKTERKERTERLKTGYLDMFPTRDVDLLVVDGCNVAGCFPEGRRMRGQTRLMRDIVIDATHAAVDATDAKEAVVFFDGGAESTQIHDYNGKQVTVVRTGEYEADPRMVAIAAKAQADSVRSLFVTADRALAHQLLDCEASVIKGGSLAKLRESSQWTAQAVDVESPLDDELVFVEMDSVE
eukprot:GFYU01000984.1.p1 GENE.GFYU01000984.1~~GFYU01000984.1.p1  ORF type:complete len:280 (+),score=82.46 GFYU01000984.1:55-894(+)